MSAPVLLVQIVLVLGTTRLVGWLLRRIHQPRVVGEMIAGILLGPSLLGWLLPDLSAAVFSIHQLDHLNALSEIGLLLFMFLVGVEFDPRVLRGQGRAVLTISYASIAVPFILGAVLAFLLYPALAVGTVPALHFGLFMGLAMSITAFPVLARILAENNLPRTRVGATAIAVAAVNDVTAWYLLAGVVLLVRASEQSLPLGVTLLGSLAYVGVMLFGVRRALRLLGDQFQERGEITQNMMAVILLLLFGSAWITEILGIHALFGAFLMGAVMPKVANFGHALYRKLETVTVTLLVPLFFAMTGLRTSIGVLQDTRLWLFCGLIIGVAVLGKLGGAAVAARRSGMSWRESGALGILVNTRGLIELVFLNIGLELGVISPTVFTMMVLMALVTTFMTTPLLVWVYPSRFYRHELDQVKTD